MRVFIRREGLQAEGVDALLQLIGKDAVNFTVPRDRTQGGKGSADNKDVEMGFAQRVMSGMADVVR